MSKLSVELRKWRIFKGYRYADVHQRVGLPPKSKFCYKLEHDKQRYLYKDMLEKAFLGYGIPFAMQSQFIGYAALYNVARQSTVLPTQEPASGGTRMTEELLAFQALGREEQRAALSFITYLRGVTPDERTNLLNLLGIAAKRYETNNNYL